MIKYQLGFQKHSVFTLDREVFASAKWIAMEKWKCGLDIVTGSYSQAHNVQFHGKRKNGDSSVLNQIKQKATVYPKQN
jgi:hypothetical protein